MEFYRIPDNTSIRIRLPIRSVAGSGDKTLGTRLTCAWSSDPRSVLISGSVERCVFLLSVVWLRTVILIFLFITQVYDFHRVRPFYCCQIERPSFLPVDIFACVLNEVCSMPNIKVFGGSSHPELAKLICERLGISLGRSTLKKFSNKETRYVEIGKKMTKPIVVYVFICFSGAKFVERCKPCALCLNSNAPSMLSPKGRGTGKPRGI